MYHYVRPYDPLMPGLLRLDVDDFKRQLDHFDATYGFVGRDEFARAIETGTPVPGVVLTFDDGLSCHATYVREELSRRGLWGIFYVATGPLRSGGMLNVHRVHRLLASQSDVDLHRALDELLKPSMVLPERRTTFEAFTYRTQRNGASTNYVKRVLNYYVSASTRIQLLEQLERKFAANLPDNLQTYYLSGRNLDELTGAGMVVGAHTINHPVLAHLDRERQSEEIKGSFTHLIPWIHKSRTKTFCYPYGGPRSYDQTTLSILREADCDFAFAVDQRDITTQDLSDRPYQLPRYDCNQFPFGQVRHNS